MYLAAALMDSAEVIVSGDLGDLPACHLSPYANSAPQPDDFISSMFKTDLETALTVIRDHRAPPFNPPLSVSDHLVTIERLGLGRSASLHKTREADI